MWGNVMSSEYLLGNDHLWAGIAARKVDNTLSYSEEAPIFLQPALFIVARVVSTMIFPILASVDFISHKLFSWKERVLANWSTNSEVMSAHRLAAQRANDTATRCFLGIIGSPVGWFYPDGLTHHFIPSFKLGGEVWNSGKKYSAQRATVIKPKASNSNELDLQVKFKEVADVVNVAKLNGKKIAIIGAGMSQGKQNLPLDDQILIDMKDINHVIIDRKTKVMKVGAGATWQMIQKEANELGLAVQVMQASNIFSVGGSLSVNCHGWDHKMGTVGNTVEAITIVNAQGQVKRLTATEDEFKYVIGGYGGFGVIVEAEIKLTENVVLTSLGTEVPPKLYNNYFKGIQEDQNVDMHLYRLSLDPDHMFETGVAVNYSRLHGNDAHTDPILDEYARGKTLERIELHAARRLPKEVRKLAWQLEKKSALSPIVLTRNQIMRPPINPIFNNSRLDAEWLQEYFVPGEKLGEFIEFLGGILTENEVKVFNASVRFVKQDQVAELGYARDGDRFALVLFFNQHLADSAVKKTEAWVQRVNNWLSVNGGTYYMPYQPFDTGEQLRKCYPNFAHVVEKKRVLDPDNIFYSGFWERIAPAA